MAAITAVPVRDLTVVRDRGLVSRTMWNIRRSWRSRGVLWEGREGN